MKNILVFFYCFLSLSIYAKAQNIITIAGNGTAGYEGDNGLAINAKLNHPDAVKLDQHGNLYIPDQSNHVVRKINSLGIITTVAGNGTMGYSGDGGPATNAQLSAPSDIAFDKDGNFYISEWGNSLIRKVNEAGIISTFAGTITGGTIADGVPATVAQLSDPFGLVFDSTGNLFFSNNGTFLVRKINPTGVITTIAGTGTNGFSGDNGPATTAQIGLTGFLAISPSNELYIPDYQNNRIRKINSSGIITTVSGNGAVVNSGDGGSATTAGIGHMWTVLFDYIGNIYLSERVSPVIRKVNTSGIITTIAGTGVVGYFGDGGPATLAKFGIDINCTAIDASGNLYVADPNNNRIRKIINHPVGFSETISQDDIVIFPNPAMEKLIIKNIKLNTKYRMLNAIGNEVLNGTLLNSSQGISLESMPKGLYILELTEDNGRKTLMKVIKSI